MKLNVPAVIQSGSLHFTDGTSLSFSGGSQITVSDENGEALKTGFTVADEAAGEGAQPKDTTGTASG